MNDIFVGIDLGTSSLKALALKDGKIFAKARIPYSDSTPGRFYVAMKFAFGALGKECRGENLRAISFSGQVGTYIVDGQEEIPWYAEDGEEELTELKSRYTEEEFVKRLGMNHPRLISYPLPRLLCLKKKYPWAKKVYAPKDYLLELLSGRFESDYDSWRGLANPKTMSYSKEFLQELDIPFQLPSISSPFYNLGKMLPSAKKYLQIKGDPDLICGANDFYCGLLGSGITEIGQGFDVAGSSEHLGVLGKQLAKDNRMVSSPYLNGFVSYGGTASSGASLAFAKRLSEDVSLERAFKRNPPIFLPYLHGERCPIYDPRATGVFYGINDDTDLEDMAYSVYEGVAFSLRSIEEILPEKPKSFCLSGGSSALLSLTKLKADVLGVPILVTQEADASALGAAILAESQSQEKAISFTSSLVGQGETILPDEAIAPWLERRYQEFKRLYPSLKDMEKQGGQL